MKWVVGILGLIASSAWAGNPSFVGAPITRGTDPHAAIQVIDPYVLREQRELDAKKEADKKALEEKVKKELDEKVAEAKKKIEAAGGLAEKKADGKLTSKKGGAPVGGTETAQKKISNGTAEHGSSTPKADKTALLNSPKKLSPDVPKETGADNFNLSQKQRMELEAQFGKLKELNERPLTEKSLEKGNLRVALPSLSVSVSDDKAVDSAAPKKTVRYDKKGRPIKETKVLPQVLPEPAVPAQSFPVQLTQAEAARVLDSEPLAQKSNVRKPPVEELASPVGATTPKKTEAPIPVEAASLPAATPASSAAVPAQKKKEAPVPAEAVSLPAATPASSAAVPAQKKKEAPVLAEAASLPAATPASSAAAPVEGIPVGNPQKKADFKSSSEKGPQILDGVENSGCILNEGDKAYTGWGTGEILTVSAEAYGLDGLGGRMLHQLEGRGYFEDLIKRGYVDGVPDKEGIVRLTQKSVWEGLQVLVSRDPSVPDGFKIRAAWSKQVASARKSLQEGVSVTVPKTSCALEAGTAVIPRGKQLDLPLSLGADQEKVLIRILRPMDQPKRLTF